MTLDLAMSQLRVAEASWQHAIKQHRTAPPDDGYSQRLRDLADACEQQQAAYEYAAAQGLGWNPLPPAKRPAPHELTAESGRPGPPKLWEAFDRAIADLSRAFEGTSVTAIAAAYGEIARIARELSAAVANRGGDEGRVRRPA